MATVYMFIFPNNKKYIGMTIQKTKDRWQNGNGYKKQPVYKYIDIYGWENIEKLILADGVPVKVAMEIEKEEIERYNTIKDGYNIKGGGEAGGSPWVEINYNGEVYNSRDILKFSKVYGLTSHDVVNRINTHGWSVEDALTRPKSVRKKLYEYNGSFYNLCDLYDMRKNKDITYRQFVSRVNNPGWNIERAMTQSPDIKVQPFGVGEKIYEYNGKNMNSYELWKVRKHKSLKQFDIVNRINNHGWNIEDAISKPPKKRGILFEYNDKTYNSHELSKICIDSNMTFHDVTDRNRGGWSVWEIVNIPKGTTRKRFYNL